MVKKEKKIGSTEIFKGKILNLFVDDVELPNGHKSTRELIRHCRASVIMTILDNGNLLIEKQYRYPFDEIIYEFPAGKCDLNEDPKDTAIRELKEETGYIASDITFLGKIYPSCAYTDEIIYCYLVKNPAKAQRKLDEDEFVDVYEISYDELKSLINDEKLYDAKTLACFAFYEALRNK